MNKFILAVICLAMLLTQAFCEEPESQHDSVVYGGAYGRGSYGNYGRGSYGRYNRYSRYGRGRYGGYGSRYGRRYGRRRSVYWNHNEDESSE